MAKQTDEKYSLVSVDGLNAITTLHATATEGREQLAMARAEGNKPAELLVTAALMRRLLDTLTDDVLLPIQSLQGTPLGFLTDKDSVVRDPKTRATGYGLDAIKIVTAQALAAGARLIGNEVNIIGGKMYLTKQFAKRQLDENPDITELDWHDGGFEMIDERTAAVPMWATWRQNGKVQRAELLVQERDGKKYDERIKVRVNKGMGHDAVIGKAEKRLFAYIHKIATGESMLEDEPVEDVNVIDGDSYPTPEPPDQEPNRPTAEDATDGAPPLEDWQERIVDAFAKCKTTAAESKLYQKYLDMADPSIMDWVDSCYEATVKRLSEPKPKQGQLID